MKRMPDLLHSIHHLGDMAIPWVKVQEGPAGDPPKVATYEQAVEAAAELWATRDLADFEDCLADMIERDPKVTPWPIIEMAHRGREQEFASPEAISDLSRRLIHLALNTFGGENVADICAGMLMALSLLPKLKKIEDFGVPSGPVSLYDPSIPSVVREGILGFYTSVACSAAIAQAMMERKATPPEQTAWILGAWVKGLKATSRLVAIVLGETSVAFPLGEEEPLPSLAEIVQEGEAQRATLAQFFA